VAVTTQPPGTTEPRTSTLSPLRVGVVVWLASEVMFFSGLFAAYYMLRSVNAGRWPPDEVELDTTRAVLATLVLVASSGTMHLAVHAVRHDARRAILWLGVTAALGAAFLANLLGEYATNSFHIDSDAYGSTFYLMTGFHGLHVLGGLLFMGAVAWTVRRGSHAPAHPAVEVCSYYWHFVDVVWLAMFTTIYIVK
jgi:cytochrome c oxidase subunit III